ncbi:hypothetical protein OH77DRAFT_1518822 [Trametes cingulata]|nr:hypothetical protein OH77DRAFT_1518822 [Trametes cingulata]
MAAATTHIPLKPISNGPNMSVSGPIPSRANDLPPKISPTPPRRCSQCQGPLPRSLTYGGKWCEACREKEHERAVLYAQRATIRAELAKMPAMRISDVQPPDFSFVPQKRKADTGPDASTSAHPAKITSASRKRIEYQTEEALFSALSAQLDAFEKERSSDAASSSSESYLNFFGGYTIVFDPDVYPDKRVELVICELKRRTTLPLGYVTYPPHCLVVNRTDIVHPYSLLVKTVPGSKGGGHSQHHWCTCSGLLPPPKPSPASSATPSPPSSQPIPSTKPGAPVQRGQSMLMKWLATGSKSSTTSKATSAAEERPQDRPGRGKCGGTITITAVVDMSHPLASEGMKGQRVTVQVQHPGRFG